MATSAIFWSRSAETVEPPSAKPEAPLDETVKRDREAEVQRFSHREGVAAAGGELLGAAFNFLGELISQEKIVSPPSALVTELRSRLTECVEADESGAQRLTVTLPNRETLDNLANTLARVQALSQNPAQ